MKLLNEKNCSNIIYFSFLLMFPIKFLNFPKTVFQHEGKTPRKNYLTEKKNP